MTLSSLVCKCIETKLQRESITYGIKRDDIYNEVRFVLVPVSPLSPASFWFGVTPAGLDLVIENDSRVVVHRYYSFASIDDNLFRGIVGSFLEVYHSLTTFYSIDPSNPE